MSPPHRAPLGLAGAALVASALASSPAAAQEKFALAVFHFNAQYVAGGTLGFTLLPDPELDLDDPTTEDRIVTESLDPVLELYERHPSWGVDIEMQAYLLDVLGERHPAVLDRLRRMAKSGQLDVVSFHYSDQLFIAYPEEDWLRSQALAAETFARWDVPLGRSVFCQEGQAGRGLAARMVTAGYRTLMWPKNLLSYQRSEFDTDPFPLYRLGDAWMVPGGRSMDVTAGSTNISVRWTFMDDGELLATNDMNPYFPELFRHDPASVAAYEAEVAALEADGYVVSTVDDYVTHLETRITPREAPPLLDGTWQPGSTRAVAKWLGGKGLWPEERDAHVRSLDAAARRELVAAETAATAAGLDARERLDSAWRLLFLAEVSDASGINPFRGEMEYGLAHATEALRIASDTLAEAREALGLAGLAVDPESDAVTLATGADPLRGAAVAEAPLAIEVHAGDRATDTSWELVATGHHRVAIRFGAGDERQLWVGFPGDAAAPLVTTLALADSTPVSFDRAGFDFEEFWMALPVGLLSVGTDRFVIKDQATAHLAARIERGSGDVVFEDQTAPIGETTTWVFHVFEGSAVDAVALAGRVNSHRRIER